MDKIAMYKNEILKVAKEAVALKKKHRNPDGGLNAAGRRYYNRATGSNLQRPVSKEWAARDPVAAKRREAFCRRMTGMLNKRTSEKTRNDPNSRINKSLRIWDC